MVSSPAGRRRHRTPPAPIPPSRRTAGHRTAPYRPALLGDHRVRAGGPGVDLVVHQVQQLEDVDVADRSGSRNGSPVRRQTGWSCRGRRSAARRPVRQRGAEQAGDLSSCAPSKTGAPRWSWARLCQRRCCATGSSMARRSLDLPAVLATTRGGFQYLADVHTAGDAERVEHDVPGVPSARNGMSSTGRILEMTPLLPCRPASLSPS